MIIHFIIKKAQSNIDVNRLLWTELNYYKIGDKSLAMPSLNLIHKLLCS